MSDISSIPGTPVSPARLLLRNRAFLALCLLATTSAVVVLCVLLMSVAFDGWDRLSWDFLDSFASRKPDKAGIKAALFGSLWVVVTCALTAIPIGVGTALYLEEFAPKNRLTRFIQLNITNLAGVPSIVYGIIGLTAFSRMFGLFRSDDPVVLGNSESFWFLQLPFGPSVLAAGLTLMLVILPMIIVSSQEAIRSVPGTIRQGSLAMGATTWQTVWRLTLPAAIPTILTGTILAISRAIGEAAPLLVVGAALLIFRTPENLMSSFTVLPLQIFNWAGRPQAGFHSIAAAAILVQLGLLIVFNGTAVALRLRLQKPLQ
ncbi:MAG: phosphate ABC transporter permease PstA [Planctomycetota bacterium]|nr:phosphate ABC transporter permease PstA [Planctomycetota bacterium]MDA1105486.1 phosphate ABC transporter permease PstA [Planctomycetota bacterium]